MSLDNNDIPIIKVVDPRVNMSVGSEPPKYVSFQGARTVTFDARACTSVSNGNLTYQIKTPSIHTFINKYLYHRVPVRIVLNTDAPNGNVLLRPGCDAFRAFPLSQIYQSVQVGFNGNSVTQNVGTYISALMRYNTPQGLLNHEYSLTPSTLDASQNYSDLSGSIKNPLSFYGDGYGDQCGGRGSFPFTIVSNTQNQAVIDAVLCEPLYISPFRSGDMCEMGGLGYCGLDTMSIIFNIIPNAYNRMWSHNDDANILNLGGAITSGNITFNNFTSLYNAPFSYNILQPALLFEYLTPSELQIIPRSLSYPYYNVLNFGLDALGIAPQQQVTLTSSNIVFNSIPSRLYLFCRLKDTVLQSSPTWTDTFLSIENVSITFNNVSGMLSSCSKQGLYNIAVRNGCCDNWTSWSGEQIYKTGSFTEKIAGAGGVLAIDFVKDLGLNSPDLCPGVLGNFSFVATCIFKWNNTNISLGAQDFTFYIIPVMEGVFTIQDIQGNFRVGVLSREDVLQAKEDPNFTYEDYVHTSGGNIFNSIRKFGENVYNKVRMLWNKYGRKISPYVKSLVPMSGPLLDVAEHYLGDKEEEEAQGSALIGGIGVGGARRRRAGALVGGKILRRRKLMDRLI